MGANRAGGRRDYSRVSPRWRDATILEHILEQLESLAIPAKSLVIPAKAGISPSKPTRFPPSRE
ncbi:MAG TPA: hypothetical protein VFJ13_09405 [Paracoccaceae bacterium]|nr:hypothetical protein [Paracoccaceae bacterium]